MTVVSDHPLVNGFAPAWATEWGGDEYGPWTAFQIGQARQLLRWIPPGRFQMGSPDPDPQWDWTRNELPRHWITLRHGFWMFDTLVTQELWEAVMGENRSRFEGPQHPVEHVSWLDCEQFVRKANERIDGLNLRLPTEAEWEYACRAGRENERYGPLDEIAWYETNSDGKTHAVKQKTANDWGLFDTLGNVWEWCQDVAFRRYTEKPAFDPLHGKVDRGAYRVIRGGSWFAPARHVRAAYRYNWLPGNRSNNVGFRCLSSPEPSQQATWR